MLRKASPPFSIAQARALVRDLFEPRPWIYWTDFLTSLAIGMACFTGLRRLPWSSMPLWVPVVAMPVMYIVCCLTFYRASLFTHELTHLKKGSFKSFRVVWNLL